MDYDIRLKRIYDPVTEADGARVLVDRLWPRGKRKDALKLSRWYKNAAPSSELRRAWHQGGIDAEVFARDYEQELRSNTQALIPLMREARAGRLTLLTATRDPQQSYLTVLRAALRRELEREDREADGRESSSPTCCDR